MRRLLLKTSLAITLVLAAGATVLAPTAGAADADRTRVRLVDDAVRPIDEHDPPRIRCRGRVTDEGAPTVRCRWTARL